MRTASSEVAVEFREVLSECGFWPHGANFHILRIPVSQELCSFGGGSDFHESPIGIRNAHYAIALTMIFSSRGQVVAVIHT
jgi:hypothetical protein